MDPNVPLVTPELVPPIKVEIHGGVMEIGTLTGAFDDVVKYFDTLQIDFSKITWENYMSYNGRPQQKYSY